MTRTPRSPTNAVAGYLRVSTEEQAQEGVSLAAQEARVRAYCEMRGLDLLDLQVDAGVSGYKPLGDRDGGRRVLDLVRGRKVAAVVALKLDRLFRNCANCLDVVQGWDRAGVSLHLVDLGGQAVDTSSAMGRFFLTVMAGAAEMERNLIGERTSLAMRYMASRGEYTGGNAKYGFVVGDEGVLVAEEHEQAAVGLARGLRASGMSLRQVADELARLGHISRAGKPFVPSQISKMCS